MMPGYTVRRRGSCRGRAVDYMFQEKVVDSKEPRDENQFKASAWFQLLGNTKQVLPCPNYLMNPKASCLGHVGF